MTQPQIIPLDEALAAEYDIEVDSEFQIETDEAAQWASRKLRQSTYIIDDAKAQRQRELDRIDAWFENATRSATATAAYFESLLTYWHERAFREATEDRPAKKTIPLVGATLKSVASAEKLAYDDEEAFIEFARHHLPDDVVKTTQSIVKSEAKNALRIVNGVALTHDGEVVPGVTVIPESRSYSVKVNV